MDLYDSEWSCSVDVRCILLANHSYPVVVWVYSSVRLERLSHKQVAVGSNPTVPTGEEKGYKMDNCECERCTRLGTPYGEYIIRTAMNEDGTSMEREHFGYKARDTGEIIWKGTFQDVFDFTGERTGLEPFDRHMAYWERRYAARRFARRLGTLPTYSDLYEKHYGVAPEKI